MKAASRRKLITAILLSTLAVLLAEFSSSSLPPPLDSGQQQVVRQSHLSFTVAVVDDDELADSDRLLGALRATGLFDRVSLLSDASKPDLIAYPAPRFDKSAGLPVRTALTLGIVPTSTDEEWGEVFSLRRPDSPQEVIIDFSYKGSKTLGWIATFLNISPERTADNPRETLRYHDALSWAICEKESQIQALLEYGK